MKLGKIFFALLFTASLSSLSATAQNTEALVATLQHGDKTTVYTGVNAFIHAYNAAADSADIITLSSGTFNSPGYIQKSITVYGAGWKTDSTGIKPTDITGDITLQNRDIIDEDGNTIKGARKIRGLHFEGLSIYGWLFFKDNSGGLTDLTFKKCYLQRINFYTDTENVKFEQCFISENYIGSSSYNHKNMFISNCRATHVVAIASSTIFVDHSILTTNTTNSAGYYTNCIIYGKLAEGSIASKNIFVNESNPGTGVQVNESNWYSIKETGIFVEGAIANQTFEHKYPNKYLGTDGTQVGVHGGRYPWSIIPATPRIVESNIDTETSADGKLKVSIKVEAY